MPQKSEYRISEGNGLILEDASVITINSGAADLEDVNFSTVVTVAAESGTADDLTDINNAFTNQFIILKADTGDTITVKSTGNINVSSDFDLTATGDRLGLIYNGSSWDPVTGGGGGSGSGIGSLQSYTPTLLGATTAGTTVYQGVSGRYKYIGDDLIWVSAQVRIFSVSGTGAAILSLPVAAANGNNVFTCIVENVDWNSAARFYLAGRTTASSTNLLIKEVNDAGASTNVAITDFGLNDELFVTGCYEV